jgi:pimeloyl-ACP methyl ester carboxylesterase
MLTLEIRNVEVYFVGRSELIFTSKSIRVGENEIRYLDEGTGTPVLMLHDAPTTSFGFVRVIQELKKDFRVIAPDLPGFGESSAHRNFTGSLREYSRFVEQFCEALDLSGIYLYVNDSSGIIGLHAATQVPERMAGLVVADTVALPIPAFVRFILKYVVNSFFVRYLNRKWNLIPWMVANLAPFKSPLSVSTVSGWFLNSIRNSNVIAFWIFFGRWLRITTL